MRTADRATVATARRCADQAWLTGSVLNNIGIVQFLQGEYGRAAATFRRILALAEQTGDRVQRANALDGLAEVAESQGRRQEAITYLSAAIDVLRPLGDRHLPAMEDRLRRLTPAGLCLGDNLELAKLLSSAVRGRG